MSDREPKEQASGRACPYCNRPYAEHEPSEATRRALEQMERGEGRRFNSFEEWAEYVRKL